LLRTVFRAPARALATTDASLRLILDGNSQLHGIPTDRGVGGNRTRILTAVSRAALDFQFKAEYAYDMGMPQWLCHLDHTLSALRLDRLFLGRHKIFHFRVWYRDALARYLRETLLDANSLSRAHIHRRSLENIVEGHLSGVRNYTTELHKLLTLELLHRSFTSPTPVRS
jgi:asparagine synthase (glutamine-hydrolysing)